MNGLMEINNNDKDAKSNSAIGRAAPQWGRRVTIHAKHSVTCSCGHVGTIHTCMWANPQPWESYLLEGLNGTNEYGVEGFVGWDKVFEKLMPSCPKCGRGVSPANMV